MLQACGSVDTTLPSFLLHGFPIVGEIARSGRWPPYEKPQKDVPISEALARAWVLRRKIINRVRGVPITDNLQKIWDATIEDVEEKSCLGPFVSEEEVTQALSCEDWIPTQRFEVVQKNKVRGCDSATTNMINQVTRISEKLQLPSTDSNVAALRRLKTLKPDEKLAGWVLDERKAYRQVAVRPDHRKFSVICLRNPETGAPNFFIMVGHSFGLVSAVYNYNRRSAAINEFLVSIFGLVAFSFYDDKYGFDQKKLQLSASPTILGVRYNLDEMQLEIKAERKEEITQEIDAILSSGLLDPGSAGKLARPRQFTSIVPVEMVAAVLALETFADRIRGADILLLIDSAAVEGALVKGYSSREDLCKLISVFWELAFKLRVRVFIDRVSTDANPADAPSRDKLSVGEAAGWQTVDPCWPEVLLET
eukprot:s2086_g1.t1